MAEQSALPSGESWSAESSSTTPESSFSAPSTRWTNNERYLELEQLEQDARRSSDAILALETEIRDLSATFETLRALDAQRVERLGQLGLVGANDDEATVKEVAAVSSSENVEAQEADGLIGEETGAVVVQGGSDEGAEQLKRLKSEHEAAQSEMLNTQVSLEQKRTKLGILSEKHRTLSDLIAKEAKVAEEDKVDESLQSMKDLTEDIGRLVGVVERLKDNTAADKVKQQKKPRVFHPVTSYRNRSQNLQNGSLSDGGLRFPPPPSSGSRSKEQVGGRKEPAEFEEREGGGGNRKRHKSSTFELDRTKLEIEEKKQLQKSLTNLLSKPSTGLTSTPSRQIFNPSPVFRGLEDNPTLESMTSLSGSFGSVGPGRSESTGSQSAASPELSAFSFEKVDPDVGSTAAKRLDFEFSAKKPEAVVPFVEDTASSSTRSDEGVAENVFSYKDAILKENPREDVESEKSVEEGLVLEDGGEEILSPLGFSAEGGNEEIPRHENLSREGGTKGDVKQVPEIMSPEGGGELPNLSSPEARPEEIQSSVLDTDEARQGEIPGAVSEGLAGAGNGTDVMSSEDTEIPIFGEEPAKEAVEGQVEMTEIPTEEFDGELEIIEIPTEECDGEVEEIEIPTEECGGEVEEIEIPSEEFDGFRDAAENQEFREEEAVAFTENGVEEIDIRGDDIVGFEGAEAPDEMSEGTTLKTAMGIVPEGASPTEISEGPGDEEDKYEAPEAGPRLFITTPRQEQNGVKTAETSVSERHTPPEAEASGVGETKFLASKVMNGRNWRLEAENQMMQLSSQLSLLQKKVEEEVELHEKSKNNSELEQMSVDKEQLVFSFAEEVGELRQNIDEIQRILYREGGDLSVVEHWARDLHSKCADQSAQLEHLGKQVSILAKDLNQHMNLRVNFDDKLDKQAQERQAVEGDFTDLSRALAFTVSTIEKEEEAAGEFVEHQKHLLVDRLNEAEKLRHIAEVRVGTLNKQIEQLELVCDIAQNIQVVSKYQDKALKYGFQTLVQLFMLAVGVITLYTRIAKPLRGSLVPT